MAEEARGPEEALDPGAGEEQLGHEFENLGTSRVNLATRVVALGGSAGSISALQHFFAAMPSDSGMAFVVILHLAGDHESALDSVLQHATTMPVERAGDGRKVLPDHVYVIPPGKHLSLSDGHLRLTELPRERGRRMTVDVFFRSLAETHGQAAVGIVLSGGDGDGALGIKRLKERGGLTIAQDPEEAEHPGMPRSAIATRMVDWVLRAGKMPERLLGYQARELRLQLPPESGPNPALTPGPQASNEELELREVLSFLRARTGRDFSNYKRATIVRRVARRMQVNEVETLPAYLEFLHLHPGEAGALLQDLLISVTNFFRDREAFAELQARIPELFQSKMNGDTIRVWVPACATGEEAYSIAMLLNEHARTLANPPALQVFATDLNEEVLSEARIGIYPNTISNDVSPERLQRFFVQEHGGYRVRRELRETLLFAVHDLLKDSPFSRIDLVSCRNLLIYLNRSAQKRVFDIFHFSLHTAGWLFLGASESADDSNHLFAPLDKKHRLYSARRTARASIPVLAGPSTLTRSFALQEAPGPGVSLARIPPWPQALAAAVGPRSRAHDKSSWSDVHLKLLERLGPPSLLVDANNDVMHLSASAAPFLHFTGGEPSMNLLRALHPMLAMETRAALFRARQSGKRSSVFGVPYQFEERRQVVNIHVSPASDVTDQLALVVLEATDSPTAADEAALEDDPVARHLENELEQTKRQLREMFDQQEAATEELQASNEELQAMNEELRSATEELETSREELQSINEELTTVNSELKNKVEELSQTNNQLRNLMGSTAIATIFLDRALKIMSFTPPAVDLFSLIPADVGRPLAHLRHRLSYPELLVDAARVLDQLAPIEREVSASGSRFYLARLLPYRATEDRIAGVVLTFIDVTELHVAQEALLRARQELEQRVHERTAELDSVNQALRAEVAMHQRAEKARQDLQRRLVTAQEQERSRISRELHDEVGQQIMALMLALKSLEAESNAERASEKVRELREIAEQTGREIHQLASQLRPVALDELGLSRALSGYLDSWMTRSGIAVDFFSAGLDESRLPEVLETTVYRIIQEAMNNVYKHAAAKSVSVSVERRGPQMLAIVEDDGAGFDPEAIPSNDVRHLGIAGMRERASIVDGELAIESRPGGGTTVRMKLPIPPAS